MDTIDIFHTDSTRVLRVMCIVNKSAHGSACGRNKFSIAVEHDAMYLWIQHFIIDTFSFSYRYQQNSSVELYHGTMNPGFYFEPGVTRRVLTDRQTHSAIFAPCPIYCRWLFKRRYFTLLKCWMAYTQVSLQEKRRLSIAWGPTSPSPTHHKTPISDNDNDKPVQAITLSAWIPVTKNSLFVRRSAVEFWIVLGQDLAHVVMHVVNSFALESYWWKSRDVGCGSPVREVKSRQFSFS